jgi:hypothetical protein
MRDPAEPDDLSRLSDPVGLCATCAHVKVIANRRGSTFYRCQLAEVDPRFEKYPRLPVLRCTGYSPASSGESGESADS